MHIVKTFHAVTGISQQVTAISFSIYFEKGEIVNIYIHIKINILRSSIGRPLRFLALRSCLDNSFSLPVESAEPEH